MTKKLRQKRKYLENGKSFKGETKSIYHHFKVFSLKQLIQGFLEDESPTLKSTIFTGFP